MPKRDRQQQNDIDKQVSEALFESSLDCVKVMDLDGRLLAMNANGQRTMEIENFAAIHRAYWISFWPEESQRGVSEALRRARQGETAYFTAFCPTARGILKLWDVVVTPIRCKKGPVARLLSVSRDITAIHQANEQSKKSHELLIKLTQQAPGVLFQFQMHPDGGFSIPFASAMGEELFEVSPLAVQKDATLFFNTLYEDDRAAFYQSIVQSAATLQPWHFEFRVNLPKQGVCWREGKSKPEKLGDGSILWHGFVTDISPRKNTEQIIKNFHDELEKHANYDQLTGLPNRRLFRAQLDRELASASQNGRKAALLFLDLDGFKQVNDLLGHDAGDALLREAAARIERCVRPGDTAARLGGDEFTVILTEAEKQDAELVAQRIIGCLAKPFTIGQEQVEVSASIGIAIHPEDGQSPEQLIRNADQAMYLAKSSGRSKFCFFGLITQRPLDTSTSTKTAFHGS